MTKEGYQPIKTEKTVKIIPPNTGSNVQPKKDGGFDNAKNKMGKRITELEKENTVHTLDVLHKEAVRKYGEVNEQLTKAKEMLKCFLIYEKGDGVINNFNNFLNEVAEFINYIE